MPHSPSSDTPAQLRLDYETPQFLSSLYADSEDNLRFLEDSFNVKAVTRDGWILFQGEMEQLELIEDLFQDLESALRSGSIIGDRDFQQACKMTLSGAKQGMAKLSQTKLLGAKGKAPVIPKTPTQLDYLNKMASHDVVFGIGPAGTGKTYLAVAMALSMLKNKEVNRIILTRPAVEAGEALGFLPGDLQEKISPYLRPLYDAISDMLSPTDAEKWMENGTIEIAPLAYMRGRTMSRACVILDEAQNTTCEQMFMFLTRIGEGTKCFITGDTSQIDLKKGITSGLVEAEQALCSTKGVAFTHFKGADVIRHPVVAEIIDAYDLHRKSN